MNTYNKNDNCDQKDHKTLLTKIIVITKITGAYNVYKYVHSLLIFYMNTTIFFHKDLRL